MRIGAKVSNQSRVTDSAIFLLVRRRNARAGKFSLLPDRHKGGTESQRDDGAQQKSPGIETDDDINLP